MPIILSHWKSKTIVYPTRHLLVLTGTECE